MDPTGESVRRVSDFGFDPSFSPDGREIAVGTVGFQFPMERSGRGTLWAIDVRSGAEARDCPAQRCGAAGLVAARDPDRVLGPAQGRRAA